MLNMFASAKRERDKLASIIKAGAFGTTSEIEALRIIVQDFEQSHVRKEMLAGAKYYIGEHDITKKKRTAIGPDGQPMIIANLPNSRITDNQYAKAVDKKTAFLLSKPFVIKSDKETYSELLNQVLGAKFQLLLQDAGTDAHNAGIAYLYPYVDEDGSLSIEVFSGHEFCPSWSDKRHETLENGAHIYPVETYVNGSKTIVKHVDWYCEEGVYRFVQSQNGALVRDAENPFSPYFSVGDSGFYWGKLPIIPVKLNSLEIPLIHRVKSLQDAYNTMISLFVDNMQEDFRNTILVIENYDGENLGEFRRNLATYGAVKVRSDANGHAGVSALHIEVNADNYESITQLLKRAILDNANSIDAKDERLSSGTPNEMNIQAMYDDISLDADKFEAQIRVSFEKLIFFVNRYLEAKGYGKFDGEDVTITFNRNLPNIISQTIENINNSVGIVSNRTLLAHHPFVDDVDKELKQLEKERNEADPYAQAFTAVNGDGTDGA